MLAGRYGLGAFPKLAGSIGLKVSVCTVEGLRYWLSSCVHGCNCREGVKANGWFCGDGILIWRTDGHGSENVDKTARLYVCDGKTGAKIRNYGRNWGWDDDRERR
jgi:hypothetical protein